MRQINRIRIVVGFPADAKRGRQILAEVTKFGFIRQLCLHRGVDLDLVAWDTHAGPGIHDDGVQGWIDLALQICDCDLFVAVFRSNLGTSFSKGKSGTVYEIESAIKSYRESKSPQVWVCFPHDFKDDSDNSNEDLSKELQEYIRFVRDNSQEYPIAYLEYSSWIELTDHFSSWLFKFIFSKTDSESQGSPQIAPGNQTKLFYTVNSEITQVPVESLTCPVGNIDITFVACSERKDAFKWHGRIVVYLNSTITSPLIGKFSLTTLTVLTTAESTGQWIPQSRCSGVQSGANAIEFEVTVTFDGAPNSARLVVENLFANANLLGMSSTRQPTTISAYVTATSFDSTVFPLVGKNLQGQVASLYVALQHQLISTRELEFQNLHKLVIHGQEYKAAIIESKIRAFLSHNFVNQLQNRDLPKSSTALNNGIRILFRFFTDEQVVGSICAPISLRSLGGSDWNLVLTDANGSGLYLPFVSRTFTIEENEYTSVRVHNNSALAVYQISTFVDNAAWIGANLSTRFFALLNQLPFNPVGSVSVNCSLAPISTVTTASGTDPIPRFADTSISSSVKWK